HVPWYIKAGRFILVVGFTGVAAWWLVDNSYRITGFNPVEAKQQMSQLNGEKQQLQQTVETLKTQLNERENQLQVEKAAQAELARSVSQLSDENAGLKEDLGFLRNIMSSGSVQEGISIANFKVEPDAMPNEYRYRLLLTQGGQRKQGLKVKVQLIAGIQQQGRNASVSFPAESELRAASGEIEFRFYQKLDGRFKIPADAQLKNIQVRILALPGYDIRTQKTINL
ncbi:MAG: hypothetical protein JNM52_06485, partial [Betaproteobacteria bacterium]|nr:hypothetical protein [Betaproteobacteria bacterium]